MTYRLLSPLTNDFDDESVTTRGYRLIAEADNGIVFMTTLNMTDEMAQALFDQLEDGLNYQDLANS